ncbi:MAG: hypothetical protein ACJAVV_001675 [Alphaproteobacteria bacterium]|jgi:hypothetical protein
MAYVKYLILLSLFALGCDSSQPQLPISHLQNANSDHQFAQTEDTIERLIYQAQDLNQSERVAFFSKEFLETPYADGPLGDGDPNGYDSDPLYRFDLFDCTTYVETIMALSLAEDFSDFEQIIDAIRYRNGKVSYVTRNHFSSLDWIPNNKTAGFIENITNLVSEPHWATTTINKVAWYEKLHQQELDSFLSEAIHVQPTEATIPYIHLDTLFIPQPVPAFEQRLHDESVAALKAKLTGSPEDNEETRAAIKKEIKAVELAFKIGHSKLSTEVLNAIPHGSIINIVRPNWNLKRYIGTNLNISHQGIAIWDNGRLYYRNASSLKKKVIDYDFVKTFQNHLTSSSIKGFDVLKITD